MGDLVWVREIIFSPIYPEFLPPSLLLFFSLAVLFAHENLSKRLGRANILQESPVLV